MNQIEALETAGLSGKEAATYLDLQMNGESRTGKICERTRIPSSYIYSILNSLVEKGLVTYKVVNNIKIFMASDPDSLAQLFEEKEKNLREEKQGLLDFITKLKTAPKIAQRQNDFRYYSGTRGIKAMYAEIINSWKTGDEYCIASAPLESFRRLEGFFLNVVHKKRIKDKVKMRIIINRNSLKFSASRKKMPLTETRYLDISTKTEYGVLNEYFFMASYGEEPYALLIKDRNFAETYKTFFNILWKDAKEA